MPAGPLDFGTQLVGTMSATRTILLPLNVSLADLPQDTVIYGGGDAAIDLALSAVKSSMPVTVGSIRSDFGAQNVAFVVEGVTFSGASNSQFQSGTVTTQDLGHTSVEIQFAPTELGFQIELAVPRLSGVRIDGSSQVTYVLNVISPLIVNFLADGILRETVTGTGLPPILVEPNPLDFGSQSYGSSSPPLAFTITNKMTDDVLIADIPGLDPYSGLHDSIADADAPAFELVSDGCTGKTLAPDGECEVVLRFRPNGEGYVARRHFNVVGNFADTPAAHSLLTGTAEFHALLAEPTSFDFGSRPITTAGNESMVFLTPQRTVSISALRFDGTDAESFAIVDEALSDSTARMPSPSQSWMKRASAKRFSPEATLQWPSISRRNISATSPLCFWSSVPISAPFSKSPYVESAPRQQISRYVWQRP